MTQSVSSTSPVQPTTTPTPGFFERSVHRVTDKVHGMLGVISGVIHQYFLDFLEFVFGHVDSWRHQVEERRDRAVRNAAIPPLMPQTPPAIPLAPVAAPPFAAPVLTPAPAPIPAPIPVPAAFTPPPAPPSASPAPVAPTPPVDPVEPLRQSERQKLLQSLQKGQVPHNVNDLIPVLFTIAEQGAIYNDVGEKIGWKWNERTFGWDDERIRERHIRVGKEKAQEDLTCLLQPLLQRLQRFS